MFSVRRKKQRSWHAVPAEVQFGNILDQMYEEAYLAMILGKTEIDRGIAELSARWRDNGGEEILADVAAALRGATPAH